MLPILLVYYGLLQIIGFMTMGVDKRRAIKHLWRIPEKRLWIFAWLGGGLGLWLGMVLFHHKSRRLNFRLGFPFFTIIHLAFIYGLIRFFS